jgi:hypothetical protein
MRPYAQLVADEQRKLYRILTFLFCALQMLELESRLSKHWGHMDSFGHWTAIAYLIFYPAIALSSLKKNVDPVLIALMAYALLGMMTVSSIAW